MYFPSIKVLLLTLFTLAALPNQAQLVQRDSVVNLVTAAGRAYQNLDNKKSLQYAEKALNQAYAINDNELIARVYNIIGLNFTEYNEYKKAEDAYLKGLERLKNSDDISVLSWIESNIGTVYQVHFKDYDKAIYYHVRSLENSKKLNSEYDILSSLLNIGILYFDKFEFEKGFTYVKEAEKYLLKVNEPEVLIAFNSLNALYYQHKKDFKTAEKFYLEALEYCDDEIDITAAHSMELYDDISNFYASNNNKEKAYDYLVKHIALKDSIYSKEKMDAIANYANQMDLDLYKQEITKIEKLNEEQEKIIFYAKIIGVLFVFIALNLLFVILLLRRNQNQKNRLISQIENKNIQLELAKEQAEELSELKTQFISNVSHELRTPLYGVIGLSKILEQDFPVLKGNRIIKSLNFSADYLMNLINDLLQLQKIEAKVAILEKQYYDINEEINFIVDSLSTIAHNNKNKISINQSELKLPAVKTDKLKLNQILYNLISNALKFTSSGTITISINQHILEANKIELEYCIQDTGNGISNQNLEVIFDKFSQFHTKGMDYQGTGLGLSIVKKLITIFEGSIDVKSEVGVGTTFTFRIPCEQINNNLEISYQNKIDWKGLNINVLLVENNEINRLVNQHQFNQHQIPCTIVPSAREALAILEHSSFSVILTDINMPEINGFQFAKKVRDNGFTMPIIALTAYSKQDLIEDLDTTEIQDVVTKPFDFEYLLSIIHKYVVKV